MTERLLAGSILDDQIALESWAVKDGVNRYRAAVADAVERDNGAALKPAERLLIHWLEPLEAAIREEKRAVRGLLKTNKDAPGIGRAQYGCIMLMIRADRMAVVVIRCVLSACLSEPPGIRVSRIAYAIGRDVVAEINHDLLRIHDRQQERKSLKELDRRFKSIRTSHVNWWARKTLDNPIWQRQVCTHLGTRLLWMLIGVASCADYDKPFELAFHHERRWEKSKKVAYLRMAERAHEIISDGHGWRQYMRPSYLPMIVPPYPWHADAQGGYVRIRTPIISKLAPEQRAALRDADLSQVYECLNAINATAWRGNRDALDAINQIWKSGGGTAGIPHADDFPVPPPPAGFDPKAPSGKRWRRVAKATKDRWFAEAGPIRSRNVHLQGERKEFVQKLDVAQKMADQPRFYFPHYMDFRGRSYPKPVHLNHQGDDVCRGILEFADARTPGDRGIRWLKIHAANCYGVKGTFDERIEWADAIKDRIMRVAADPGGTIAWWAHEPGGKKRKEAWQLLAACKALADPDGAGAHLPVQLDGTCNGLQHYAALGRDTRGASMVNLCPAERPNDIYSIIAEAARPQIIKDAEAGNEQAVLVADHISRDLIKQPVMTTVYGVTVRGARDQLFNKLKKLMGVDSKADWDEMPLEERKRIYKASVYLSRVALDAIGSQCASARAIMDWMAAAAREITSQEVTSDAGNSRRVPTHRSVRWTTPLGLPVVQPYRNSRTVTIQTVMQYVTLHVDDDTLPVRPGKQADGMPPNFVHSIDATHMMMVARQMKREGLAFAAVHDSFWTHAASADRMSQIIREQFVALHEQPLLENLHRELQGQSDAQIPPPPARGSFDLKSVLEAPYAFS